MRMHSAGTLQAFPNRTVCGAGGQLPAAHECALPSGDAGSGHRAGAPALLHPASHAAAGAWRDWPLRPGLWLPLPPRLHLQVSPG